MRNQVRGSSWLANLSQARHTTEQKQKDHEDQAVPHPYLLNCPGLQHFMMGNRFLPGSQLLRMQLLLIIQPPQTHCSTGSNSCRKKTNTTSQLHPKHTQILLTLSVDPRRLQDWLVLPWTNSLELKRCCQAAPPPNGSICDLIASH